MYYTGRYPLPALTAGCHCATRALCDAARGVLPRGRRRARAAPREPWLRVLAQGRRAGDSQNYFSLSHYPHPIVPLTVAFLAITGQVSVLRAEDGASHIVTELAFFLAIQQPYSVSSTALL
jgi:hypothetical protein